MKKNEIKVGESYGYAYRGRNPSYGALDKFTVTEIREGFVRNKGYYGGSRKATIIVGTLGNDYNDSVRENYECEPRNLHYTWDEVLRGREEARRFQQQAADREAAQQAERRPKVERLDALLLEAGFKTRQAYVFNAETAETGGGYVDTGHVLDIERVVQSGVVDDLRYLDEIIRLVDHLQAQVAQYRQAARA